MNQLQTLYRRSLDGIEIWNIEVIENIIKVTWGKYKGKQTTRETIIKEGKNIGKSNETSVHLQAELEAKSKWKKKIEREGYYSIEMLGYEFEKGNGINEEFTGYLLPINKMVNLVSKSYILDEVLLMLPSIGTTNSGKLLPMLAKKFYQEKKVNVTRAKFPLLVQPKFNGVRALMRFTSDRLRFFSREGLEYKTPLLTERLNTQLNVLYSFLLSEFNALDESEFILDGELYIHNTILADIVSAVKKPNLLTGSIAFYCYDIAVEDMIQVDRLKILKKLNTQNYINAGLHIVPTRVCRNIEEAEIYCDEYKEQGYEGLIGRNPLGLYQFGARSSDLLKLKRKISGEFKILDVYDTPRQPGLAMFKCKNDINNEYFEVVPEGTHEQRRLLLNDRSSLLGKMLTVEYYERTAAPKEAPFNAVGIVVRDYE